MLYEHSGNVLAFKHPLLVTLNPVGDVFCRAELTCADNKERILLDHTLLIVSVIAR